ncbi:MAG: 2-phospho-L-lactate guanylyltransferase [Acidimicrobiia bacterium]|nr:2-phospho-L-lactate guanylyltransferase [Acidimicrobiia bacterium]
MDIVAVPIKPFGLAKARLASSFSGTQRAALGRATATRTVTSVLDALGKASVVTADEEVAEWAGRLGASVIAEPIGKRSGLNGAAREVVSAARGGMWMIIHADLPLITVSDIRIAWAAALEGDFVLAPSHDGGTSVIGGIESNFAFSYGPGSFHRHLAATGHLPVRILTRLGFLLDLDDPTDHQAAIRHPLGIWLTGTDGR